MKRLVLIPKWTPDNGWIWLRFGWKRMVAKHDYLDGGRDFWWQWRGVAP